MPPFQLPPAERTLTLQDVATIFRVTTRTIRRWVAAGRLPRPRIVARRIPRWKACEIQQHIDNLRKG